MSHPALQTLFLPFTHHILPRPAATDAVLYLNGQFTSAMADWPRETLAVRQPFKPAYDTLQAQGYQNVHPEPQPDEDSGRFDLVLIALPKQRAEALGLIAEGLRALKPEGRIVCAAANDAGGKRLRKDMEGFGLSCHDESKHKARVVWATKPENLATAPLENALRRAAPQPILDGQYISQPGLFGWDKIDVGSALLAGVLADPSLNTRGLKGKGADFGCGYGFLSRALLQHHADIKTLHMIDADHRALSCCRQNLANFATSHALHYHWADIGAAAQDASKGVSKSTTRNALQSARHAALPAALDFIVMNPPFHEGKVAVSPLGQRFIAQAAQSLRPGGRLWMVANVHLPYEDTLAAHFKTVRRVTENLPDYGGGFKIFEAQ